MSKYVFAGFWLISPISAEKYSSVIISAICTLVSLVDVRVFTTVTSFVSSARKNVSAITTPFFFIRIPFCVDEAIEAFSILIQAFTSNLPHFGALYVNDPAFCEDSPSTSAEYATGWNAVQADTTTGITEPILGVNVVAGVLSIVRSRVSVV